MRLKFCISLIFLVALLTSCGAEKPPRGGTGEESNELDELFPLKNAPEFKTEPETLSKINAIIDELKGGYGGTLVNPAQNLTVDSAPFVAHFLRAFSKPPSDNPEGLKRYDYHFERLLSRLSANPESLDNPLLDWDIFRAFLEYERFYKDSHNYQVGNTIYGLDSAKDLLWMYLHRHAKNIATDAKRRHWWIEQLSRGLEKPNQRPLRAWYLLLLVANQDDKTRHPEKKVTLAPGLVAPPYEQNRMVPNPWHVFIEWENQTPKPASFTEGIKLLSRSQELGFAVLGIDPEKMPAPKIRETNLSARSTTMEQGDILDQECWSAEPSYYNITYSRPVGSRSLAYRPNFPKSSQDGVFFFTYNGVLYVWKKERMNDAALFMLRECNLLSAEEYEALLKKGFKPLSKTLTQEFTN